MRIFVCFVFALTMTVGCSLSPTTGVVSNVEILDFGFQVMDKSSPDYKKFFGGTTSIPYRRGTEYGIKIRVNGEPAGSSVNLKLLWILTPASATTRQARSTYFELERTLKVGESIFMKSTTARDGGVRRPYKRTLLVGDIDGTVYAEMDFWIGKKDDDD